MMQSIIRDYSEKRDFIRMKIDTTITLNMKDKQKSITGVCKDLSGTGMLIEVDEAIGKGTELQTSLPSNNAAFPALETTVKVVRCSELENGGYLLGTEILKVDG